MITGDQFLEKYSVLDLGYNKLLTLEASLPQKLLTTPEMTNVFTGGVPSASILSGDFAATQRTVAGSVKRVAVGDNIQEAVDFINGLGGGTVILENGNHFPTYDINLYSNVSLIGQTEGNCVIDFNNTNKEIKAVGSSAYSTGTVSVTTMTLTVTGAGTVWTAAMIGQSIFLQGLWYPITNVNTGAQTLTIAFPFADTTLAGATYIIASPLSNIGIANLTLKNTVLSAIDFNYVQGFGIEFITFITCTVGIKVQNSSEANFRQLNAVGCQFALAFTNVWYWQMSVFGSISGTFSGIQLNSCQYATILSGTIIGTTGGGGGIGLTSCNAIGIINIDVKNTVGIGIELVSGNSAISLISNNVSNNTSDGIKLTATSNNCDILNNQISNNGAYGVNIANANCTTNYLIYNHYTTNTSGTYNNLGTTTRVIESTGLAGSKIYYVSDTNGGAVNRKLTFTDGILTAET